MAEGRFPTMEGYVKKWSQALIEALKKSAFDEMTINKGASESGGDIEHSNLIASIRFSPVVLGKQIEFQFLMTDYWQWLEKGRKAGKMPPEAPILKWIAKRGIKETLTNKRKSLLKKLGNKTVRKGLKQLSRDKALKQIAFAIRKKIGNEGTRATHFYSNVVTDKLISDLKQTMKEKFKQDIIIELTPLAQ